MSARWYGGINSWKGPRQDKTLKIIASEAEKCESLSEFTEVSGGYGDGIRRVRLIHGLSGTERSLFLRKRFGRRRGQHCICGLGRPPGASGGSSQDQP